MAFEGPGYNEAIVSSTPFVLVACAAAVLWAPGALALNAPSDARAIAVGFETPQDPRWVRVVAALTGTPVLARENAQTYRLGLGRGASRAEAAALWALVPGVGAVAPAPPPLKAAPADAYFFAPGMAGSPLPPQPSPPAGAVLLVGPDAYRGTSLLVRFRAKGSLPALFAEAFGWKLLGETEAGTHRFALRQGQRPEAVAPLLTHCPDVLGAEADEGR